VNESTSRRIKSRENREKKRSGPTKNPSRFFEAMKRIFFEAKKLPKQRRSSATTTTTNEENDKKKYFIVRILAEVSYVDLCEEKEY